MGMQMTVNKNNCGNWQCRAHCEAVSRFEINTTFCDNKILAVSSHLILLIQHNNTTGLDGAGIELSLMRARFMYCN